MVIQQSKYPLTLKESNMKEINIGCGRCSGEGIVIKKGPMFDDEPTLCKCVKNAIKKLKARVKKLEEKKA